MPKAVIYARVSTEMQAEEEISIPGQIEECHKFAASKGWEVETIYKDEGYSGRTDERPAFQKMISRAKELPRPFDIILSWRSNRLFRSVEHRLAYNRILRRKGIRFIAMHEPEFEGASAMFMETVLAAADELYAAQIAEDTLRGLKQVARQGFSTGGRPPTGYRNVRKAVGLKPNGEPILRTAWEPDPELAPRVKQAFEMSAQGATSMEICQETKVVSNKSSLSSLLRNRSYLGERIYNTTRRLDKKSIRQKNPEDQVIRVPDAHSPIISQELFNQVQAILDSKRPCAGMQKPASRDYLLSGILWCKKHQALYAGHSTESRSYYACSVRKKYGSKVADCSFAKKEALERFILDNLKEQIFTPERVRDGLEWLIKEKQENEKEDTKERIRMKAQLAKVNRELDNLYNAVKKGISPDALEQPIEETRQQKVDIEGKLASLTIERESSIATMEITDELVNEIIGQTHRMLEESSSQELKVLLNNLLDKIEIDGREVTIWYTIVPCHKVADYWRPRTIGSSQQQLSFTLTLNPDILARTYRRSY